MSTSEKPTSRIAIQVHHDAERQAVTSKPYLGIPARIALAHRTMAKQWRLSMVVFFVAILALLFLYTPNSGQGVGKSTPSRVTSNDFSDDALVPNNDLSIDALVPTSKEAYVTFLSDIIDDPNYGIQAQLLIFQLRHDPLTADPTRDFIIMVTKKIPRDYIDNLIYQGAKVVQVDNIIFPGKMNAGQDRWKDQFTKLHIFNLEQYSRVLYIDNDFTLAGSYAGIWDDPAALEVKEHGGIATHPHNDMQHSHPPDTDIRYMNGFFNAGFWMSKPSKKVFEELLLVEDFDYGWKEQGLLNAYYHLDGTHPWKCLGRIWAAQWGQYADIEAGVVGLHEKVWHHPSRPEIDRGFTEYWNKKLGRMEGYWLAKDGR